MIANVCAVLLCCFALTANIKTIDSAGSQIAPIRFFTQTSNEDFVLTVNRLITFKKHPINITSTDVTILSTPNWYTVKDYKLKLKSRDKLEKKAQDIKCSFCVIVKSKISYLKNLIEKLKSGEPFNNNDEEIVTRIKEEAEIVLHLLLSGNLETDKWLWSYYLKIVAIVDYDDDFRENPFGDDQQLQSDISEFIENCVAEKYLPVTAMECDFLSKKSKIYDNLFGVLRDSELFEDILAGRVVLVTIAFLYLKPFWLDGNPILFGQIADVNVDWSKAKKRFDLEVAITREFLDNRIWVYEPYGRLDHQRLLVKIIDARIYCYLSIVLDIYLRQLTILDHRLLTHINNLIYNIINDAMSLTAFKDEFLVAIVSEFNYVELTDVDDIKDILARVRTKANEILKGLSVNEIDWLSFGVDERQLFNEDLITEIIDSFEDFINEIRSLCLPFEYKALLHFMDVVKTSAAQYI